MAVLRIARKPELTKDQAREIFARKFSGKYRVEKIEDILSLKTAHRDFQVMRNPFLAVAIKLEQSDSETRFVYAAMPGRRWTRIVPFIGLVSFLLGREMTHEVEEFMRNAPEFT